MSAVRPLVEGAWRALASFLRGFVGMPAAGLAATSRNGSDECPGSCPSPAAAREALTARAANRPSCC